MGPGIVAAAADAAGECRARERGREEESIHLQVVRAGCRPARDVLQRLLRPESLLLPELRPELPLERPLLLLLLLLLPLLLLRDDPSSRLPPRWRLLSDWLREEPLLPRDELPDPDDLFDWFAMECSS